MEDAAFCLNMSYNELLNAAYEALKIEPRPWQRRAIEGLIREGLAESPQVILVHLPTGYGKTAIGESLFLAQLLKQSWISTRGLVYVLPTRALTRDLTERIARNVSAVSKAPQIVKQFHGEELDTCEFYADVCVSTFDTFVYCYARRTPNWHLEFPAGTIATSYVVFDEAHMLQDEYLYSHQIMASIVKRLNEVGVPVVISTATIPSSIEKLVVGSLDYVRIPQNVEEFRESVEGYRGVIEEVRLVEGESMLRYVRQDDVLKQLQGVKRGALVVCNRVSTACEVWRELRRKFGTKVSLIHSRLRKETRDQREEELKKHLAARREETSPIIAVVTQVVEAGIDISADLLITEWAPADSLVQRAGRCARYPGDRGRVIIVRTKDYAPYPRQLLEDAWKELRQTEDKEIALMELRDSYNFIENSYRNFSVREIPRWLEDSLTYLDGVSSFTVDWQMLKHIRARPNATVTLVAFVKPIELQVGTREFDRSRGIPRLNVKARLLAEDPAGETLAREKGERVFIRPDDVLRASFTAELNYLTRKGLPDNLIYERNKKRWIARLRLLKVLTSDEASRPEFLYELELVRDSRIEEGTYILIKGYKIENGFELGLEEL